MASPAIYMYCVVCLEYADHLLRMHKVRDNILLRNLFVLMTSSEMVAMSRLMSFFSLLLDFLCVSLLEKRRTRKNRIGGLCQCLTPWIRSERS